MKDSESGPGICETLMRDVRRWATSTQKKTETAATIAFAPTQVSADSQTCGSKVMTVLL